MTRETKKEYAVAYKLGLCWQLIQDLERGPSNNEILLHTEEEAQRQLQLLLPEYGCANLCLMKLVDFEARSQTEVEIKG